MELTTETKTQIIKNKINSYNELLYSLQLDYKVATVLEDENAKNNVQAQTKKILRAIETLQTELDENLQ